MSALAPDALAGLAVAIAPTESDMATTSDACLPEDDKGREAKGEAAAILARGLAGLGAEPVGGDGPADLVVVAIDGGSRPERPGSPPSAEPSLAAASDGDLAAAITEAFGAARDAFRRLRPGGCILFVLANASADHADIDPARAAIGSLTRTLALEWAPERRVNALVCAAPEDAVEAAALIAWPPSRTLTGAVLDVIAP